MTPASGPEADAQRAATTVALADLIALRLHLPRSTAIRRPFSGQGEARGPRLAGRGLDYAGSRHYLPGDEARRVDWRQSARRGSLYVKEYAEEAGRPSYFLVDLGKGMRFATRGVLKSVLASRTAAFLAWRATAAGDRIRGEVWLGGRGLAAPGSRLGPLPLLRLLASAGTAPADAVDIGLHEPLRRIAALPAGAAATVISDFASFTESDFSLLAALAGRVRLRLVEVIDPIELSPPTFACVLAGGNGARMVDFADDRVREEWIAALQERTRRLADVAALGGRHLRLETDARLPAALAGALA